MKPNTNSLVALAALLLPMTCTLDTAASSPQKVEYSVSVSENGAALDSVKLSAAGGKIQLPRGAWKCEYAAPETTTTGSTTRGQLDLKCSMGAAVIKMRTSCQFTSGPARSEADVLHDAQGVTLTVPNGKYSAYIALGCSVR